MAGCFAVQKTDPLKPGSKRGCGAVPVAGCYCCYYSSTETHCVARLLLLYRENCRRHSKLNPSNSNYCYYSIYFHHHS